MSEIKLLETFLPEPKPGQTDTSFITSGLLLYSYTEKKKKPAHLIIKGEFTEDIVSYCADASPEIYDTLVACLQGGSLFIDLDACTAWRPDGRDTHPETERLVEAFSTITSFPDICFDPAQTSETVSIILGAGKGTRMRSKDFHKICFPVAGRPSINRLLDQLESVGIRQHIIVVGEKGQQVVSEVTDIRNNVNFVYQINQNGTGNATKQAAYFLRAHGFDGKVLVVPGDKVIEKSALVRLMKSFREQKADSAIVTDEKKYWPDAGRIVFDRNGRPVDIVEKRDIQRMILCGRLLRRKRENPETSSGDLLNEIVREIPSLSRARTMFPDLIEFLENNACISLDELQHIIVKNDTGYTIKSNNETSFLTGEELESKTPVTNAAVYLFSADAFFNSIFKIKSVNAQNEEYFTEVFRILSQDTSHSWKILTVPVRNRHEVMSYNNPEEFLKIEEYYSHKESKILTPESLLERIDEKFRLRTMRPVEEWQHIFENFGPELKRGFRKIYGNNENIFSERREVYRRALDKFIRVYGKNHSVIITRSPGRVNLMGRHVEHRGGYTNYMTINREVILVAGIRDDDIINIHNVDSQQFRPREFSIGHELSRLPWDEWLDMINSSTVLEMIHASRGDWSNYFKAAALRLQEKFKDRLLYGFNGVLSGQIPPAAGLSSSSAVVVSAAEALTFINGLSLVPKDFVDLCGEGEWFVGTEGGSGDYTAMKFGEKGNVLHMKFQDVQIVDVIPFPRRYRLIILQSHQDAKKSAYSMQIFNERVAAYEIAHEIVKLHFPQFSNRLKYFRDINTDNLGLSPFEIYDILLSIPERVTRMELLDMFPRENQKDLELVFSSHEEPSGGYKARAVAMYGLSEIARARQFARLLKEKKISKIGQLMNISHNGDRVSTLNEHGERVPYDNTVSGTTIKGVQPFAPTLKTLRKRLADGDSAASLYFQPGGYGCSTPLIDEMVDISLGIGGVEGAQISGAGLGGCIMALVRNDAVDAFQKNMTASFYEKHNLIPEILVCSPIAGSGIFYL